MKIFATTKQRRVFLPLVISVLLCLACGCGAAELDPDANVFIVFDSAAEVRTVSLTYASADEGAQYADGTPLRRGATFGFTLPEADGITALAQAYAGVGEELGEPLVEGVFTLDLSEGKTAVLTFGDDADGALMVEHSGQLDGALSKPAA